MGLRAYMVKRVTYAFLLLLLVISLNFMLFRLMPGDPTYLLMNPFEKLSEEGRKMHEDMLKETWGLDQPLYIQYVKYLGNLLRWNLMTSIHSGREVAEEMLSRIPYTLVMIGISITISIIVGVMWGCYTAQKRGTLFDSVSVTASITVYSLPVFWLGMVLILVFSMHFGLLPHHHAFPAEWTSLTWPQAWTINPQLSDGTLNMVFSLNEAGFLKLASGYLKHSILPVLTLTLFQYGGYLLLTRATMLETLTEDYIVTARAKGLKERTVLFRHAFKNASLPLITSAALSFGFMFTGAIITETVFGWPGLGGWIWVAIQQRDYPVLMGIFYVIALMVIVSNVIADLLYGVIDPRIKYG